MGTEMGTELPTVEAALAYGAGYAAGLADAKDQDVAKLIRERDIAVTQLAFERALRQHAERGLDEVRARCAELEALTHALTCIKEYEGKTPYAE